MPKLFISYRREDTLPIAGRVDDRLKAVYGRASVFRDIDTIPPGVDFRQHISNAVSQCDALIALIGSGWLDASHDGHKRLENPGDFVRIEIEVALARGIPVVPVLVDGAAMPQENDLPPSIGQLAYRNAVRLDSGVDFHHHMDRLLRGLDVLCNSSKTGEPPNETPNPSTAERVALTDPARTQHADSHPNNDNASSDEQSAAGLAPENKPASAPFRPMRLSLKRGIVLTALVLALNSVLAALGSVLWEHFPYWPAFMVFALVCAYYRIWGIWIATLSPVVATLIFTGGSAVYLYVLINLMQALLVIIAFQKFKIDPRLLTWRDRIKYLGLAVTAPSLLGACSAWLLRWVTEPASGDPALPVYALWWTAENLLPAIYPGIWLHRIVGDFYRPFSWDIGGRARSWMTRAFEYATPWMITLLVAGCLVIFMVTEQIGTVRVRPAIWKRVHEIAAESLLFRGLVLAMSVSLLVSLGYAIRQAKQAWVLEEAVRRHLPTQQEAERILSGKTTSSERRLVAIISISIRMFTKRLAQFRPAELIAWLNAYFDRAHSSCSRYNGCIDKYTGDDMLLIFGLKGGDSQATEAIRCSLHLIEQIRFLNKEFERKHLPQISIGMGIHTGFVITGEIGSRDRRQYMVVGDAVYAASDIGQQTEQLSEDLPPLLISHDTIKEAGLLLDARFHVGFGALPVGESDTGQSCPLYTIRSSGVVCSMLDDLGVADR